MDLLLIEVPTRIVTERLILRRPRPGDGPIVNAGGVCESIDELRPWAPWAQQAPSVAESEAYRRRMHAAFELRSELAVHLLGVSCHMAAESIGLPCSASPETACRRPSR